MFDQWACSFFAGSVAEWLSGIATVAAVVVALWIALRDGREREKARTIQARVVAAFLMPEVARYSVMVQRLIVNAERAMNPPDDLEERRRIELERETIMEHLAMLRLDRLSEQLVLLPTAFCAQVAEAFGSVELIKSHMALLSAPNKLILEESARGAILIAQRVKQHLQPFIDWCEKEFP